VAEVRAVSPRKNGVVSCVSLSTGTPGPRSRTVTMIQGPACYWPTWTSAGTVSDGRP
jgi:hypothetical protein